MFVYKSYSYLIHNEFSTEQKCIMYNCIVNIILLRVCVLYSPFRIQIKNINDGIEYRLKQLILID